MKLFEIVSPQVRTTKPISRDMRNRLSDEDTKNRFSGVSDEDSKNPMKFAGGGAFADVYTHKKRPGSVIKIGKYSTDSPDQDAYLSYVNLLVSGDRMASNPYFPRVYSVKIYPYEKEYARTNAHTGEYVVELEKLASLETLSAEELDMWGNRIFKYWKQSGPEIANNMFQHLPSDIRMPAALIAMMREAVNDYSPDDFNYQIKDEQFKEAAQLLRKLVDRSHIADDLHINNIMVRRTSVGAQLVITDPVKNA